MINKIYVNDVLVKHNEYYFEGKIPEQIVPIESVGNTIVWEALAPPTFIGYTCGLSNSVSTLRITIRNNSHKQAFLFVRDQSSGDVRRTNSLISVGGLGFVWITYDIATIQRRYDVWAQTTPDAILPETPPANNQIVIYGTDEIGNLQCLTSINPSQIVPPTIQSSSCVLNGRIPTTRVIFRNPNEFPINISNIRLSISDQVINFTNIPAGGTRTANFTDAGDVGIIGSDQTYSFTVTGTTRPSISDPQIIDTNVNINQNNIGSCLIPVLNTPSFVNTICGRSGNQSTLRIIMTNNADRAAFLCARDRDTGDISRTHQIVQPGERGIVWFTYTQANIQKRYDIWAQSTSANRPPGSDVPNNEILPIYGVEEIGGLPCRTDIDPNKIQMPEITGAGCVPNGSRPDTHVHFRNQNPFPINISNLRMDNGTLTLSFNNVQPNETFRAVFPGTGGVGTWGTDDVYGFTLTATISNPDPHLTNEQMSITFLGASSCQWPPYPGTQPPRLSNLRCENGVLRVDITNNHNGPVRIFIEDSVQTTALNIGETVRDFNTGIPATSGNGRSVNVNAVGTGIYHNPSMWVEIVGNVNCVVTVPRTTSPELSNLECVNGRLQVRVTNRHNTRATITFDNSDTSTTLDPNESRVVPTDIKTTTGIQTLRARAQAANFNLSDWASISHRVTCLVGDSRDQSKVWQEEITYSCGAGVARVNLYTGRLLVEVPDFIMGENSYQTTLTHIYNSHSPLGKITAARTTKMGQRWKLNQQHYLDGPVDGAYTYTDANGMRHRFISLPGHTNHFYDTSGLGLVLNATARTITDDDGNIMTFSSVSNGYMTRFRSAACNHITLSNQIAKVFAHTAGDLRRINDARHGASERIIELSYNGNLLSKMSLLGVNPQQNLYYIYDQNMRLIQINKVIGNQTKAKAFFVYDTDGLLQWLVDGEDFSAIRFNYISNSNPSRLGGITKGILITGNGPNNSIRVTLSNNQNYHLVVTDRESFTYSENSNRNFTQVIKNNRVTLNYHFKHEGEFFGVVEQLSAQNVVATGNFRSVIPSVDEGIKLHPNITNSNNSNFDSTPIVRATSQSFSWSSTHQRIINEINQNRSITKVVVSGWIFVGDNFNGTTANLRIRYRVGNNWHEFALHYSCIDINRRGQWQYVEQPFEVPINRLEGVAEVSVHLDNNSTEFGNNNSPALALANIRLTLQDIQARLQNADSSNREHDVELDFVESVSYSSNLSIARTIRFRNIRTQASDNFITANDIIMTQKSMLQNRNTFIFTFNGGKSRILTRNGLVFQRGDGNFRLGINENNDTFPRFFAQEVTPHRDITNRTQTFYNFIRENNEDRIQIVARSVATPNNNNAVSLMRQTFSAKGMILRWIRDEYDVSLVYNYDTYNNLLEERTFRHGQQNTLLLIKRYAWNTDTLLVNGGVSRWNARGRETIGGETNERGHWTRFNTPPHSRDSTVVDATQRKQRLVRLTSTLDNILSIDLGVRASTVGSFVSEILSSFRYNHSRGLMERILNTGRDNYETNYTIGYNDNNIMSELHANNQLLVTRNIVRLINDRILIGNSTRYANTNIQRQNNIDNYERLSSVTENDGNNNALVVTNRDLGQTSGIFGSSAAKTREIVDEISNKVHRYFYDMADKNMIRYLCELDNPSNNIEILGVSNNQDVGNIRGNQQCVERNIRVSVPMPTNPSYSSQTLIHFDSDKYIAPRLTYCSARPTIAIGGSSERRGVTIDYRHDNIGRIRYKTVLFYIHEYKYLESVINVAGANVSTNLISNLRIRHGDREILVENYTYDNNGNITRAGNRNFTYDNVGRLSNVDGREITYDAAGNINQVAGRTNSIISYGTGVNTNRIVQTKFASNNFVATVFKYDEIGNPIVYDAAPHFDGINMIWTNGRFLHKYIHRTKGETIFVRDTDGKVASKTNGGITKRYYYEGNKIIAERWSNNINLYYEYDESGISSITQNMDGFTHNFAVLKDIRGNIRRIMYQEPNSLVVVAEYDYDAFGNITSTTRRDYTNSGGRHIADRNPFLWKGYYFDWDTDFYVINNENYDPIFGRFINPVDYSGILSEPWKSPYAAFDNNFVMAPPNPHNFNAYIPVETEIQENRRRGWFARLWGGMPLWAQVTLGGVVLIGTILAAVVTVGKSLAITAAVKLKVPGVVASTKLQIATKASVAAATGAVSYGTVGLIASGVGRGDGWCWISAGKGFGQGVVTGALVGAVSGFGVGAELSPIQKFIMNYIAHSVASVTTQIGMGGEFDAVKFVISGFIGATTTPLGDLNKIIDSKIKAIGINSALTVLLFLVKEGSSATLKELLDKLLK